MKLLNPAAKEFISDVAVVRAIHRGKLEDDCISLYLKGGETQWKALCRIEVWIAGRLVWVLDAGFTWNGADIPGLWQRILGISRYDPRVALASGFHDDICRRLGADNVQRVVGDALFISLLMPIEFNDTRLEGVSAWKATEMYCGVRAYSGYRFAKAHLLGRPVR